MTILKSGFFAKTKSTLFVGHFSRNQSGVSKNFLYEKDRASSDLRNDTNPVLLLEGGTRESASGDDTFFPIFAIFRPLFPVPPEIFFGIFFDIFLS